MYKGIQSSIWSNKFRTTVLIILFPALLFGTIFLVFLLTGSNYPLDETIGIFYILGPILLIWLLISFWFNKQILFKFSGAKEITRKEEPEIYNIVENLCISRGLATPNIGIIEDKGMNAFAVGREAKNSWIVFTRGLINKLDRDEIEAVAAHELSHIINKDNLIMTVIVIFIGIISTIGYIIFRSLVFSRRGDGRAKLVMFFIGLALLILGSIVYPIMKFAVSRKREYLADAGAVELTKNNYAMISALEKISRKPQVNTLKEENIANMCIEDPLGDKASLHNMFSTHPSIENRIKALKSY